MKTTDFGHHTLSYRVILVENGGIHLEVHHKNHSVRRQIEKHLHGPRWFLRYLTIDNSGNMAVKHLKEVVFQFQDHFREGRVSVSLMEDITTRRRILKNDGSPRFRKGQNLTKTVTDYLLEKLPHEFPEC